MKWFNTDFWKYALDDSNADKDYGPEWYPSWLLYKTYWMYYLLGYGSRFLCRWRGHPAGMIWNNPYGSEPNMRCKDCGEDLG